MQRSATLHAMTHNRWCFLSLLLLLVAGCAPITPPPATPTRTPTPTPTATALPTSTSTPAPTATPTPVPVSLKVLEGLPPDQARALAEDVAAFLEQNPDVMIELRHYDEGATLLEQVDGAGQPAWDVALGDSALMAELHGLGRLQPLDELLPPDVPANLAAPGRTAATLGDHLWGLADTLGFHLLVFYNRDLIAVPPSDTDELTAVAQSFTERDRWGLVVNSYDPLWVVPWLTAYGGWLVDEQGQPNSRHTSHGRGPYAAHTLAAEARRRGTGGDAQRGTSVYSLTARLP